MRIYRIYFLHKFFGQCQKVDLKRKNSITRKLLEKQGFSDDMILYDESADAWRDDETMPPEMNKRSKIFV